MVGGVTALLLAPSSGAQIRARLARKAGEIGEATSKKAREIGEEIRDEVIALDPFGNGHGSSSSGEAT